MLPHSARLSFHAPSRRSAPSCSGPCASASHCCSAGTLKCDRACIRSRPSWTSGVTARIHLASFSSTFSLCGTAFTSPGTSAPPSYFRCLVARGRIVKSVYLLLTVLVRLLLAMLFLHGSWGPTPWLFGHMGSGVPIPGCLFMWVLGSQSLAVWSYGFWCPNPWLFGHMGSGVPIPGCFTFLHGRLARVSCQPFGSSTAFIDFDVNFSFKIAVADQSVEPAQSACDGLNHHTPRI